ncbi:hypothetical protein H5T88_05405 [bacterium]|nr:hypothetical protein [bacterium]
MIEIDIKKEKLVREIIRQRFDNPEWEVFSNIGERKERGIRIGPNVFYPSIVVLKMDSSEVIGVGEVETEEAIDPQSANRWQMLSKAFPSFWLYIPKSKLEETRKLLQERKIKKVLLRTWEVDEKGTVTITDL